MGAIQLSGLGLQGQVTGGSLWACRVRLGPSPCSIGQSLGQQETQGHPLRLLRCSLVGDSQI